MCLYTFHLIFNQFLAFLELIQKLESIQHHKFNHNIATCTTAFRPNYTKQFAIDTDSNVHSLIIEKSMCHGEKVTKFNEKYFVSKMQFESS